MTELEAIVGCWLLSELQFSCTDDTCAVYGEGFKFLSCVTPIQLFLAFELDLPMSFSVTLPEQYWRSNAYDYVKSF